MSRTIDEKVVEMRFDNQDFERNVSQSMSTLDKLKNALDFSGVDKTFSGLTSAANKLDFGSVGNAIEDVGSKFTWLETIATGALLNIGASISSNLIDTLKGLTLDQVGSGYQKYEQKTKAVQTIMSMTGAEIEEVNKQLEKLNYYTDETSYDFAGMVDSIAKFTSNGVDLETSVTSMEAIANWGGLVGASKQNVNSVMYQLSKSLSRGFVQQHEWASVMQANMADETFKQLAIDVALAEGTLAKFANTAKIDEWAQELFDNYGVNASLEELNGIVDDYAKGVLDIEKAMRYTGMSAEDLQAKLADGLVYLAAVNEQGEEILKNEKDGIIMPVTTTSFDSTLTKGMWFTSDVLLKTLDKYGSFTDKINEWYNDLWESGYEVTTAELLSLIDDYKKGTLDLDEALRITGMSAEDLDETLAELSSDTYDLGRKAFDASSTARTFLDAIESVQEAVSTQFMNSFELIFGNFEEAKDMWTSLSNELYDIFAGPLAAMNEMLAEWREMPVGGRLDFIEGIKNIYYALRSIVDPIAEAWEKIFPPLDATGLADIVTSFKDFTESLILSEDWMTTLGGSFEKIFDFVRFLKDGIGELAGAFTSEAFRGGEGFFKGIGIAIESIGDILEDFTITVKEIKSAIDDFKEDDWLGIVSGYREQHPILTWLVETFDKLKDSLGILGEYTAKLFSLNDIFVYYGEAGGGIAGILNILAFEFRDFITAAGDLVKIWTDFDMSDQIETVWDFVHQFELAIEKIQADGWFTKIKDDLIGVGTAFTETFGGFRDFFGPVFEALGKIVADWVDSFGKLLGGGKTDLEGFFETIDNGLISLQDFIKTNETLKSVMDGIKDTIKIISDFAVRFLSIGDAMKVYEEAGGGLAGIFAIINEKIQALLDLIGTLVQRFTGLDLSEVGNGILLVIKVIEEGFVRLADRIAQLFGWKDNPFHTLLETSESSFTKLQELFAKFGGMDTSGFTGLGEKLKESFDPVGSVLGGIGKVIRGVWSVVQAVLPLIGQGLSWFGDVLVSFADKLKGMSFREILDIVKIILTIVRIKQFIDIFDGFGDVLDEVSDSLKAFQAKLRAEAFEAIGRSILMVAAAIVAISLVPTETLKTSLLAIAAVLIALTVSIRTISDGLSNLFTKSALADVKAISSFARTLTSLAATFVGFGAGVLMAAAGMWILVNAVKALSGTQNEGDKLGELAVALAGIALALGLVSHYATGDRIAATGAAILTISAALAVLAVDLKLLEHVNWESLGKMAVALVALEGITGALVVLSDKLTKGRTDFSKVGKGLLEISAALAVTVVVMKILEKVDWLPMLNSLAKFIVILTALGLAAVILDKFTGKNGRNPLDTFADSLLKLGKAVLLIGGGILLLGVIAKILGDSAKEIADAGVDLLVTVMDSIVARTDEIAEDLLQFVLGVLHKLAEHTPEIVQTVIEIIAGIFQGVREAFSQGDFGLVDFAAGAGVIGGLIGIVILVNKAKITAKDFVAAAAALAGASVLLVELGALFMGIGWLSEKWSTDELESFKKFSEGIVATLIGVEGDENRGGVLGLLVALIGLVTLFAALEQKFSSAKGLKGDSFAKDILVATGDLALVLAGVSVLMAVISTLLAATGLAVNAIGIDKIESAMQGAADFYNAIANLFAENGAATLMVVGILALEVILAKMKVSVGDAALSLATVGIVLAGVIGLLDLIGTLLAVTGAVINGIGVDNIKKSMQGTADFYNAIADLFVENGAVAIMLGALVALEVGLAALRSKWKVDDKAVINAGSTFGSFGTLVIVLGGAIALLDLIGTLFAATGKVVDAFGADNVAERMQQASEFYNAIGQIFAENGPVSIMLGAFVALELGLAAMQSKLNGAAKANGVGKSTSMAGNTWSAFATLASAITEAIVLLDIVGGLFAATGALLQLIDGMDALFGGRGDKTLVGWVNKAGEFFEAIANAIGKFIGGFIGGAAGSALGGVVDSITEDRIAKLTDAIERITKTVAVISTLANGTYNGATLNFDDVKEFGNTLKTLGGNLKSYYDSIDDISVSKMNKMSDAIMNTVNAAEVITQFKAGISEGLGSIKEIFESTIGDLLEAIEGPGGSGSQIGNPKKFYDAGVKLVTSFSNGLTYDGKLGNTDSPVAKMKSAFRDMILGLLGMITEEEVVSEFENAGASLIGYIVTGMETVDSASIAGSITAIIAVITSPEILAEFQSAGSVLMGAVATGMSSSNAVSITESISGLAGQITGTEVVSKFQNAGSTLMNAVGTGMKSVDTTAIANSIGSNMSAGVAQGMNNQESLAKVTKAAENVVKTAETAAKAKAQIASPSKLFAVIGKFLDEGLAEGIFENIPMVKEAASSLIGSIAEGVGGQSLIDMMKGFGFNISETFGASILEASEDAGDYGGLISQMFSEGLFSNLSDTLGMDVIDQFLSGIGVSLPDATALIEEYCVDISEAGLEGMSEYLNADYGQELLNNTVIDGMGDALTTVTTTAYGYGEDVGEAWNEGYDTVTAEKIKEFENTEIQGPTVTFVADTTQIDDALDKYATYAGQTFDKYGELDAYLLAFDMADKGRQEALITQAAWEYQNEELANALRLRQSQTYEALNQDAYWQNMAADISTGGISISSPDEADTVTREDLDGLKEEMTGLRQDVRTMAGTFVNANVYLDTGELVGAMAPRLDQEFGNLQKLGGRGI